MMCEENQKFCKTLDEMSREDSVICIRILGTTQKSIALNHMIKKGWICVQNDVCFDKPDIFYILTFATKEAAASFRV